MNNKNALKKFNHKHPYIVGFNLYPDGRFALLELSDKAYAPPHPITEYDVEWRLYNPNLCEVEIERGSGYSWNIDPCHRIEYYSELKLAVCEYISISEFSKNNYFGFIYVDRSLGDCVVRCGDSYGKEKPYFYARGADYPILVEQNGDTFMYDKTQQKFIEHKDNYGRLVRWDEGHRWTYGQNKIPYQKIQSLPQTFDGTRRDFVELWNEHLVMYPTIPFVYKPGIRLEQAVRGYRAGIMPNGKFFYTGR